MANSPDAMSRCLTAAAKRRTGRRRPLLACRQNIANQKRTATFIFGDLPMWRRPRRPCPCHLIGTNDQGTAEREAS